MRPDNVECPGGTLRQQCITLTDMISSTSIYYKTNSTIHFLPGTHTPTLSGWIAIGPEVQNLSIVGETDYTPVILCNSSTIGFVLSGITPLQLTNLEIINCGFNTSQIPNEIIDPYIVKEARALNTYSTIAIFRAEVLQLRNLVIIGSKGFGLVLVEVSQDLRIANSTFADSNKDSLQDNNLIVEGGNVLLKLYFSGEVTITNSVFANGYCPPLSQYTSGGLTVWVGAGYNVPLYIHNCTFFGNIADNGAAINIPGFFDAPYTCQALLLTIHECNFYNNSARSNGGALFLGYKHFLHCYFLNIGDKMNWLTITGSDFRNNTAGKKGGGIYMDIYANVSKEIIESIKNDLVNLDEDYENSTYTISLDHLRLENNEALLGGALYIHVVMVSLIQVETYLHVIPTVVFTVSEMKLSSNLATLRGGGIYLSIYDNSVESTIAVCFVLHQCRFEHNQATSGLGLLVSQTRVKFPGNSVRIACRQTTFSNNYRSLQSRRLDFTDSSVIFLNKVGYFLLADSRIENHMAGGIYAYMSTLGIEGKVWIANNTATNGAGIHFDCHPDSTHTSSQLMFRSSNSTLYIKENKASEYGGGIAVKTGCNFPEVCFFSFEENLPITIQQPVLNMVNNTADIIGNSIYGGDLETCRVEAKFTITNQTLTPKIFWKLVHIEENNTLSAIASQAYKTCICTANFSTEHGCTFQYMVTTFPGQLFYIPVVGVGQYNYPAPSVIRATIIYNREAQLDKVRATQDAGLACRNLSYSIRTQKTNMIIRMQLAVDTLYSQNTYLPNLFIAQVLIFIQECPHGFVLHVNQRTCNCTDNLIFAGVTCSIENQTIHRTPSMWIGNVSGEVVVHNNCPFDYCKQNVLDINPYNQQEQCDFQRSGVMCGGCRQGLSLALGTSQCMKCSNIYLFLLIPFALSGVVLVVILLKCNLTVSTGTINGLIFYANIVHANHSIYFPQGSNNLFIKILSIFIAWLNLDLGIEVCFAEKLDAYGRTWLQFVFPVYIWLLVLLLTIVSRYSITVSRLSGTNTVSVLATLFLLSYAKLLRTTFNSFNTTTIIGSNNTYSSVWLLDGNHTFLSWPHWALFFAAILVLVFHLLPFTLLVILSPLLQANSSRRLLSWVPKFKPLLDSYQGPYKIKFRYWTGLMLFVRIVLFIFFALNVLGDPKANLLAIIVTTTAILAIWLKVSRVYKNKAPNALELIFLINLLLFSASSLHLISSSSTNVSSTSQEILVYFMVGSTLFIFICTIIFHCCSEIRKSILARKFLDKIKRKKTPGDHTSPINRVYSDQSDSDNENSSKQVTPPTVTYVDLQELMEEEDHLQ